ncbi:MAG: hypothetical protein WBG46_07160 [Nonlabens sp.]
MRSKIYFQNTFKLFVFMVLTLYMGTAYANDENCNTYGTVNNSIITTVNSSNYIDQTVQNESLLSSSYSDSNFYASDVISIMAIFPFDQFNFPHEKSSFLREVLRDHKSFITLLNLQL